MKETTVTDRLTFLAEQFDIFECPNTHTLKSKVDELAKEGYTSNIVSTLSNDVVAIISTKLNEKERLLKKVSVCADVFAAMVEADPTENKMYLQWMLNLFVRLLKKDKDGIDIALRLVSEDLPQANAYLQLFEDNKRKKKFVELCKGSYSLKNVNDPTNINQYKSLAQIFDAVDPFIERQPSAVERTLKKYVDMGQAIMPVKDRKFTLYIPKTTAASVVFANFANWCTAREGNGMFESYTKSHKKPNGKNSDIYIIIDNKFFTGESQEVYQIHFETKQFKDRKNSSNISLYEVVLSESEGLSNFFYEELIVMAKEKAKSGGNSDNTYLDALVSFGFTDSLTEIFDETETTIRFNKREIPKMPNMSKFKYLDQLIIMNANMVDIHHSIGDLTNLEYLILTNNRIKTIPKEIGALNKVQFINLVGNKITNFPDEISFLDKSNGGSLVRIGVKKEDIGAENLERLKKLLPTTEFSGTE